MRRRLPLATALALAGAALWFALGMERGLLLSNGIKSRCWPWAPSFAGPRLESQVLSDPVWQFVPWLSFARRELSEGRIPLWNPHQDGGVPLLGNSQSALGSPLVWPALLLGVARGWNVSLLVRLLTALLGSYVWLRERGRSPAAAGLGSAGFALSGPFIAWLEHPQTLTAAPIPLLLLFSGRVAERADRSALAGLALSTALVLVGGHPETAFLAALLAAGLVAVRARTLRRAAAALGGALLGASLAAPFLLPFVEYFGLSEARHGGGRHPLVLPVYDLVRFVAPRPGSHPIEAAASVSIALLALVPFGLPAVRRDREAAFFAIVAGACLLVAYDNPVARLLAVATPVHWSRALLVLPLALAFLGSGGLDHLLERADRQGRRPTAVLVAGAVSVLAALELLLAARGVHAVTPPAELAMTTPLVERLRADPSVFHILPLHTFLPPNAATDYGLDDLRGYDALAPAAWRQAREEIGRFRATSTQTDALEPGALKAGGRGLDAWNVKYLVLHPQFRFGAAELNRRFGLDLEEVYSGPDGRLLLNRRAGPRLRLVAADGRETPVEILRRSPVGWSFTVESPSGGRLVVASPFFPGWTARVDGRTVPIGSRTGEAIELPVPSGAHDVALAYRPVSFGLGLALAALSAAGLVALWVRTASSSGGAGAPDPAGTGERPGR